ncbi:phage recombination protein Bet [Ralstonia mannitolilytica]|uniref:phage recombination protein Bet n=1 Tax=Ralstonia mannitolilytica TaxID=105219 RepID=UPI003B843A65
MSTAVAERPATNQKQTLVAKFAAKYSIEADKLLNTLKATAFRQNGNQDITNEQMAALLIVADQYGLNPFTKEIYAFPDKGGIVPVVGVDGWSRIINEHPQSDGFEFVESEETTTFEGKTVPVWMEVHIYRKDRARPIKVRERFAEVVRASMQPWKTHPSRMMRHKTLIQGARLAYGFAGIYDEDEAQRIVERDMGAADTIAATRTVAMPQAKAKQIEQQTSLVIEQPVVSERQPAAQRQQSLKEALSSLPFDGPTGTAELATDGEKQYVRMKLAGADIAVGDALKAVGLSTPESLEGLTRDGFVALQDYIKENC